MGVSKPEHPPRAPQGSPAPQQRPGVCSPDSCRLSPQQHLQLCLPLLLQLQLLLEDLLHPLHVSQGLLPPGQVLPLVLLLLLQERLQDALVCLLEEGGGSTLGTLEQPRPPLLPAPTLLWTQHCCQCSPRRGGKMLGWVKTTPQRPGSCFLPKGDPSATACTSLRSDTPGGRACQNTI